MKKRLTTETVESAALSLESIDDIKRCDSLSLGMFSVCDSISDDTLEEGLEDTSGLFVNHGGDTLDTTTARKTSDGRLGDTLDVVTKNLAMSLGTTLAEALATFATSSHIDEVLEGLLEKRLKSGMKIERVVVVVGTLDGWEECGWRRRGGGSYVTGEAPAARPKYQPTNLQIRANQNSAPITL